MKKLLALALAAVVATAAYAQHLTTSGPGGLTTTFNILSLGAACNGIADDGPAITAAGVAMRAVQAARPLAPVALFIPNGSTCLLKTCPASSDTHLTVPFALVTNLTIIATGATITAQGGNCIKYTEDFVNPFGIFQFNTNSIGDTCVTMTTSGQETNFPVGRWVTVAGQGMQVNSFPPNYSNWEFQQVVSTPTGKVCFKTPLKNAYPSTGVIDLSLGNCSNIYCGGPGALVLMNTGWDGYFHVVGGTWDFGGSVTWPMRTVLFDNVTFTNNGGFEACWFPTISQTVTYNNTNFPSCGVEVDKEIDSIVLNNTTIFNLKFQSASVNTLTLNNGSSVSTTGFPLKTICNNSTLNGASWGNSFGSSVESFSGTNCNITAEFTPSFFNAMALGSGEALYTYQGGGVFTSTNNDIFAGSPDLPQFLSNGGKMKMQASGIFDADSYFTITSSSVSGTPNPPNQTVTINTTLAAGSLPAAAQQWQVDQLRSISCSGCFGSRAATDYNAAAAQGLPIYSYRNRAYTCANNVINVAGSYAFAEDDFSIEGAWGTLTIFVSVPDTNPSDTGPGMSIADGAIFNTSTGANTFNDVTQSINLKTTGTRTVTATSTSGAVAGDTLTSPTYGANAWLSGNGSSAAATFGGITNGPAAQCPVVNMIWKTVR